MPLQTDEGVHDPALLLEVRMSLTTIEDKLFMVLGSMGGLQNLDLQLNCRIISEAFSNAFAEYDFKRVSGHFGGVEIRGSEHKIVQFEHSWLVLRSAPGWVVDVAPFNGMLMPLIVHVGDYPWRSMYREDELWALSEKEKKIVDWLTQLIVDIKKRLSQETKKSSVTGLNR